MANEAQLKKPKISGYLEKKAKTRFGSHWKKYWFVLEGQLLVYYKSKDEYEHQLGQFKGSINLFPPCKVKPVASTNYVFHIEYRGNNISLRAEDKFTEQRWIQAILTATMQTNVNSSRMSHFRYSMDTLPTQPKDTQKLEQSSLHRQNSLPQCTLNPLTGKKFKEKLQSIKTSACGGSLETLNNLSSKKNLPQVQYDTTSNSEPSSPLELLYAKVKKTKFKHKQKQPKKEEFCIIDNDQYCTADDAKKANKTNVDSLKGSSNLESRMSFTVENDQYCTAEEIKKYQHDMIRNKNTDTSNNLYERISSSSSTKSDSVFEENENYCRSNTATEKNKIQSSQNTTFPNDYVNQNLEDIYSYIEEDRKIVESHEYSIPQVSKIKSEHIYSVPQGHEYSELAKCRKSQTTDKNKNSVIIENETYIPLEAETTKHQEGSASPNVEYAVCQGDYDTYTSSNAEYAVCRGDYDINLYEDLDTIVNKKRNLINNNEPQLPLRLEYRKQSNSDSISQSSSNEDNQKSPTCIKNSAESVKSTKKHGGIPKKTKQSFLNKFLKRKPKSEQTENATEKSTNEDQNNIEMLKELQKRLEAKKHTIEKYGDMNCNATEKSSTHEDQHSTEMLKQFQKLLEAKKDTIRKQIMESKNKETAQGVLSVEAKDEKKILANNEDARPLLIPKSKNSSFHTQHHNIPKNDSSVKQNAQQEMQNTEKIQTIDEILTDLEKQVQKQKSQVKVKELIEKFNDISINEEVTLRKKIINVKADGKGLKKDLDMANSDLYRHSDDLDKLLDELCKVTTAPIMTPGITSSLVTTPLNQDLLLSMPIRYRRHSDPDYDVPRPHKLYIQNNKEPDIDAIPATRFFGPALPLDDNEESNNSRFSWSSIDPDSLELENIPTIPEPRVNKSRLSFNSEQDYVCSYSSHDYLNKNSKCDIKQNSSNRSLYTQPKLIPTSDAITNNEVSEKNEQANEKFSSNCKSNILYTGTKVQEVFIDSLEPFNQQATAF